MQARLGRDLDDALGRLSRGCGDMPMLCDSFPVPEIALVVVQGGRVISRECTSRVRVPRCVEHWCELAVESETGPCDEPAP